MYGQGNYVPQLGQSPHRPPRPPFLQQVNHPPASAGLFHQGPPDPSRAAIQPAAQQPHLGSSVSAYQFSPAMPPPLPRPYMPNPFPSAGQPYLPPPPTVHGSNNMMRPYSSAQQHSQLGVQSAQYISPSPPPLGRSGVLPPPPQIQNLYRPPMSTWPPPPPMPLQSCNLPSPSTFHSIAPSTGGETNTGSVVSQLPPLPPSSPPLPPPPPPSSATPTSKPMSLDLSTQPPCDPSSSLASFSGSVQVKLTKSQIKEKIRVNHSSDCELETERVDASTLEGDLSSKQNIELESPPPPPRPSDERTLRNIEILCQFISKNGPDFEDTVRQKEAGNPEFGFLFGGEAGSEAAIAHEYYLWMKDKSCHENGLLKGEKQTILFLKKKHAENTPSVEQSIGEVASCAWSDSDMDMEDDANQPGEEPPIGDDASGLQQDSIPADGGIQEPEKYDLLRTSGDRIPTMELRPPIQLGADVGGKEFRTFGSATVTDSPIKLLKEYASDDGSEDDVDACATVDEQAATLQLQKTLPVASVECMMRDGDESKVTEVGPSGSLERCKQPTDLNCTPSSKAMLNKMISAAISLEKRASQELDDICRTGSPKQDASFDDFEGKGALKYSRGSVVSDSANAHDKCKENAAAVKVDEFGRLVREGASETDSDDSSYDRRDHRRGRSRSASRSPPGKRRKSPRRRNERRSRSRSWSPKRRRSRSRSPRRRLSRSRSPRRRISRSRSPWSRRSGSRSPFRRTIDASNKSRRGGYQIGLCFNFLKGKCYRGDSCRYRHTDPDKHGGSSHHRSKHHPLETTKSSRDYDSLEEDKTTTVKGLPGHDVDSEETMQDEVDKQEVKAGRKERASGGFASQDAIVDDKGRGESVAGSLQYDLLDRDSNEVVTDSNKNATIEESIACLPKESDSKNVSENIAKSMQHVSPKKDDHAEHIQSESLTHEQDILTNQPRSSNGSSPSIAHAPSTSSPQLSEVTPCQSIKPDEPVCQQDVFVADSSAIDCSYQVSQLPPSLPLLSLPQPLPVPVPVPVPPPPPSLHIAHMPHALQPVQGYTSAPLETNHPLQTAPMGSHPSYSVLLPNQHLQYPVQRNPSWGTLPAPQLCPPYMGNPPVHGGPAPVQQESLPLRIDPQVQSSLKNNPTSLPSHQLAGSLHERVYPSMPDVQQSTPPVDHYLNSASGFVQSSSSHGNAPSQPGPSFGGTNSNKVQSFSHGILPPSESSGSHIHNPPYMHQRPSYELYQAAGEAIAGPSYISDAGHRRTAHYNPYASTFDQPLSSKFNPIMFRQEEMHFGRKYENSFSFGHPSFEAQNAGYEAGNLIPSPNSSRAGGQTLLKSCGDQYDPLFDSIDPSAGSLKKQLGPEDHAADNSDIMLRLSACKPTDVKADKKKEFGAVAGATSCENDEFGETADVEAGVVESGSESNPNDGAKVATSDDEIDQVSAEGKSKKNKESRSMKIFKVELANFVKGMLKPSWRQGNMSKEAFKTIVKKTVEKVSGAMEGHRVPKSKAKIGQYIDRSKDKLARLVQGYVNKYAKA